VPTLAEFLTAHPIRMMTTRTETNPHMKDARNMHHYRCSLRTDSGRSLSVPFSMGMAHTTSPTAEDVLDCLASDSAGVENSKSFEDWCGEYGYDSDSRSAERTYRACVKQAAGLKRLLGEAAYDELLWRTDRL
jgi:hypothetical protein